MPVSAVANTYATWDTGTSTYADLEAAPTYGILEGARLTITRTLPSSGSLLIGRLINLSFGGTLDTSGSLPKQAGYRLTGTLASSGLVMAARALARAFGGTLASSGTLSRMQLRGFVVDGTLGLSGLSTLRLLYSYYVSLDGYLRSYGTLNVVRERGKWPPLASNGVTPPPILVPGSAKPPSLVPARKTIWPPLTDA